MADIESTTVAPGVTRSDHFWGYDLEGTKEALLASGLARAEWFWSGRRGKDGRRLTTVHFKVDGNRAKCWPYRDNSGGHKIEVSFPEAEVEKRHQARKTAQIREEAKNLLDFGAVNIIRAFNVENNPEWAWRFPAETIEQAKQHLREIVQLFERGGFERRSGLLVERDGEFQRFMQRATSELNHG